MMQAKLKLANSNTPVITVTAEGPKVGLMWHWGKISMTADEALELSWLLTKAGAGPNYTPPK